MAIQNFGRKAAVELFDESDVSGQPEMGAVKVARPRVPYAYHPTLDNNPIYDIRPDGVYVKKSGKKLPLPECPWDW